MTHLDNVQKKNEELKGRFSCWLEEKGLSQKTVDRHVENIEIYTQLYLVQSQEEPQVIGEVKNNMGPFFSMVRRELNPSISSLKSLITSMRKFYTFLEEEGIVHREEREEVFLSLKELSPEGHSKTKAEPIEDESSSSLFHWRNAWIPFLVERDSYYNFKPLKKIEIERVFSYEESLKEADTSLLIKDICFLLDWIARESPRITAAKYNISRNYLTYLDGELSRSYLKKKAKPKNANEDDYPYLFFLTSLLKACGLIAPRTKSNLGLTKRGQTFLELKSPSQLGILFDTFWNHLNWEAIGGIFSGFYAEFIYINNVIYDLLASLSSNEWFTIEHIYQFFIKEDVWFNQGWTLDNRREFEIFSVCFETILLPMEFFQALECKREKHIPLSFSITSLGSSLLRTVDCYYRETRWDDDDFDDDDFDEEDLYDD